MVPTYLYTLSNMEHKNNNFKLETTLWWQPAFLYAFQRVDAVSNSVLSL